MKWLKYGPQAIRSEDGRYSITRSPAPEFTGHDDPITYLLCECGHKVIAGERNIPNTEADRKAALTRLKLLAGDTNA